MKGYDNFQIAYASKSYSDWGWTVVNTGEGNHEIFGIWLGGNIKDSLKNIKEKVLTRK